MLLGDFPEDFATVTCMFTTHAADGAPVAPLSAFEAADVLIYKNGSATQKTTSNGVTMTSPFDSIVGLHCVVIDTSNDTGDGGFWVAGAQYTLVLSPDETVDGKSVVKVIGTFGIELSEVLRPTTAGRQLDVSAGGEAGLDWANIGSPTTAQTLSGTTVKTATDVEADTQDIQSRLPAALVGGRMDSSTGAMAANVMTAASAAADLTTELQAGLATASALSTLQTTANAIDAKTTNLPPDPADASVIAGRFDTLDTSVADLPTNAELSTALASADDAMLAQIALVKAKTDNLPSDPADQSLIIDATNAIMAAISALNNLSAAQVNAEVLDVINVDTFAEPAQGTPPATTTLAYKIGLLYKALRNKSTVTGSQHSIFNDDAVTVDHKRTVADDGTTFTSGEIASGP